MVGDEMPNNRGASDSKPASYPSMGHVTQILSAIEQGDGKASEELLPLVYLCPCQAGIAESVQMFSFDFSLTATFGAHR